ncbi:MAG: hypothetical protein ABIN97_06770, partial [Ginsengibacter sp.]
MHILKAFLYFIFCSLVITACSSVTIEPSRVPATDSILYTAATPGRINKQDSLKYYHAVKLFYD